MLDVTVSTGIQFLKRHRGETLLKQMGRIVSASLDK
jgi:hypothetical protein